MEAVLLVSYHDIAKHKNQKKELKTHTNKFRNLEALLQNVKRRRKGDIAGLQLALLKYRYRIDFKNKHAN